MSHFYGDLKGNRGGTSRTGTKQSGLEAHIRGWDIGAKVTCYVDAGGRDCIFVEITGGSRKPSKSKSLGVWYIGRDGEPVDAEEEDRRRNKHGV